MKIKIGKGPAKNVFHCSVGMLSANIEKMRAGSIDMRKFAGTLAKQMGMKDGEIKLHSIEFTYNSRVRI